MEHGGPRQEGRGESVRLGEGLVTPINQVNQFHEATSPALSSEQPQAEQMQRVQEARHRLKQTTEASRAIPERVSESDPRYQVELEYVQHEPNEVYGARLLQQIDQAESTPENRATMTHALRTNCSQLAVRAERYPQNIGKPVQAELQQVFPGRWPDEFPSVHQALTSLTPEEYQTYLRYHVETTNAQHEHLAQEMEAVRSAFVDRLATFAEQHGGLGLSRQAIQERTDRLTVDFFDPYESPPESDTYAEGGLYKDATFSVALSARPEASPLGLAHSYKHELMHALSGRTPRLNSKIEEGARIDNIRIGFRMGETRVAKKAGGETVIPTSRFRWLNEAMTESLTTEVEGNNYQATARASQIYRLEQSLLEHLEHRVPRQDFREAYFENYDPRGGGTDAWGKLQRDLSEAFEPRILLKLDKIITEEHKLDYEGGLKAARDYLQRTYFATEIRNYQEAKARKERRLSARVKRFFTRRNDKREAA